MPEKLFVISNNLDKNLMLTIFFRGHGYEVLTALSLDEAAETYFQRPPDLFLLDRTIHERDDGIQFCKDVRTTPALARTPVVVMMADITPQMFDSRILFDAGANAIFGKVFDISRLLETVQILLENPQMTGLIDRALL